MRIACLTAWLACSAALAQPGPPQLTGIGGASFSVPVKSLKQMRQGDTLLQQYDFSCGSAALATLLTYHYGHRVGEREVLERMFALGDQAKIQREGFSLLDMKQYLAHLGYQADGFRQPLEKLAEARLPAIVLIDEGGYKHFVVVKGLNPRQVLIGDPARGVRVLPRDAFDAIWVGGLLFVIHNRVEQARFNLASDWRSLPSAPLAAAHRPDGLGTGYAKHGAGDF